MENQPRTDPSTTQAAHQDPQTPTGEQPTNDLGVLDRANQLKQAANEDFKSKKWQSALNLYSEALAILPLRLAPDDPAPSNQLPSPDDVPSHDHQVTESSETTSCDPRISQLRSVLHANTAACFLKLEDWQSTIQACDNSLRDDPNYVKALHRRAQANEKIGTWASLQASLDDYNKMSNLTSGGTQDKSIKQEILSAQGRLPELIKVKSEQDKAEMMGKLKHLGNSVLGKFGLSTDNFKFTPNESGGYSMSFQQ